MKTTNYEISKQLKEAGFEASYIYAWYSDSEGLPWIQEIHAKPTAINKYGKEVKLTFTAPAYDLETILDALPNTTEIIISSLTGERIFYLDSNIRGNEVSIAIEENESLADTAGKMWLELKKKNLL